MTDQTAPSSDPIPTKENTPDVKASAPAQSAAPVVVKSGGKGLSIFAILLALGAIGGSGFQYYQSQLSQGKQDGQLLVGVNQIGSDVKVLAERMGQLERSQRGIESGVVSEEKLSSSLLQASNQTDLALRDIRDQQKTLSETLTKLTTDSQRSADKLAIDEVSQLMKLANNSAVFASDKQSAIKALQLADSQLKQLADPRYSVVRKKINQEIAALQAVETVDVTSLTTQLAAIAIKVPTLVLENEPPVVGQIDIAANAEEQEMSFKSEFKKMWTDALNLVKIKRVDQPPKPLLAPEQRYFLDQNIILKLNTAELAVMQNKAEVYDRSVQAAITMLKEYYDPRDADVIKVVEELNALKDQPLGIELPSVIDSYDELQRIKGGN